MVIFHGRFRISTNLVSCFVNLVFWWPNWFSHLFFSAIMAFAKVTRIQNMIHFKVMNKQYVIFERRHA
jgi:hypothetical protein